MKPTIYAMYIIAALTCAVALYEGYKPTPSDRAMVGIIFATSAAVLYGVYIAKREIIDEINNNRKGDAQ